MSTDRHSCLAPDDRAWKFSVLSTPIPAFVLKDHSGSVQQDHIDHI